MRRRRSRGPIRGIGEPSPGAVSAGPADECLESALGTCAGAPARIEIDRARVELAIGFEREALAHDLDRERLREVGALLDGGSEDAAGGTLRTLAAVLGHTPLIATAVHTTAIGAEAREPVSRVRA